MKLKTQQKLGSKKLFLFAGGNFFEKKLSPLVEGRNLFEKRLPPLHTIPLPKTFGATLGKNAFAFLPRVKEGLKYAKAYGENDGFW